MSTETEVKFYLPDLPALRARVLAAGGMLHAPRVLETNLRFDDAAGSLTPARRVLRLRRDRRARLTYKAPGAVRHGVRQRAEHEVEVSDFEAARAILEGLGYRVSWTYEKYRETFHLGAVEAALDELPFGDFVELEGPDAPAIRAAAGALQLDWRARYPGSYSALFAAARRSLGLTFTDLTFANFRGLTVTPADLGLP
ncbi:MAG: class IV adenylate cyclase [Chloroflexi bacterium]|nr:class IV adenylate cyclase [Chloroflexota bacterium]